MTRAKSLRQTTAASSLIIEDDDAAGHRLTSRTNSFDIEGAKANLLRHLLASRRHELAMYQAMCNVGLTWIEILAWLDDPRNHADGKRQNVRQWIKANLPLRNRHNLPYSKKWMDEFAKFARRWPEFIVAWNWAERKGYAPDRQPSLTVAFDLMELKRRDDVTEAAFATRRSRVPPEPRAKEFVAPDVEKIIINPNQTLLVGDVVEMARKHTPDGSVHLMVPDPPYFSQVGEPDYTDEYYKKRLMNRRFRALWDNFKSHAEFEEFTEYWTTEAMRCLHDEGSMFICCSNDSIGPTANLMQRKGYRMIQHITVIQTNQRPHTPNRFLQHCYYTLVWVAKSDKYRFSLRKAKWGEWPKDRINSTRGALLKNAWNINNNGRENKTEFPSQKPLELYRRPLMLCGVPGGMFGDWFSGSGTGAVAAVRYGMHSTSIERERDYAADIVKRVQAERCRKY
jgi:site-specific DNA-methyltransferase (adenine-specific)